MPKNKPEKRMSASKLPNYTPKVVIVLLSVEKSAILRPEAGLPPFGLSAVGERTVT